MHGRKPLETLHGLSTGSPLSAQILLVADLDRSTQLWRENKGWKNIVLFSKGRPLTLQMAGLTLLPTMIICVLCIILCRG